MHAKDGEYPTDGANLGREKPLGEGRVNFPELMPKLKAKGFCGAVAIEREIASPADVSLVWEACADNGRAPHKGSFNVGFVDGHAKLLDETTFRELMIRGR